MNLKPRVRTDSINNIHLTDEQLRISNEILDWIEDTTDYEPRKLAGAGGSGKTTLAQYIFKEARISNKVITAPTHKAVRVIAKGINVQSHTIQKLLGLVPNADVDNFDINKPEFAAKGKLLLPDFKLIGIDEASMINKSLYGYINRLAKEYNLKVLYIGDKYQLPPVNENLSIAFTGSHIYTLDTIIRQHETNNLRTLLAISRKDVQFRTSNAISYIYKNINTNNIKNDKGFAIYHGSERHTEFSKQLIDSYNTANEIDDLRLCGYSNLNILNWNKYIRDNVVKSMDQLADNDILTGYSTVVNEFNEAYILNSEDYYISELGKTVNPNGLKGFIVKLRSAYDLKETPYLFILDHTDEDNVALFLQQMNNIISNIYSMPKRNQGGAWKNDFYNNFKDKIILMKSFYDEYGKLIIKKDLDYAYSLTIHKTQGSTYNDIFINVLDILYNKNGLPINNIDIRNRLLYVALSRARNKAHLLV